MLQEIIQDMQSGFPNDRQRLYESSKNLDFYHGKFSKHWSAIDEGGEIKPRRTLMLSNHIVNTICNTNKEVPTRVINDDIESTSFLASVYKDNKMFAKLLQAERLSCVSQCSALQVAYSGNPEKPILIHLWDGSNLVVYVSKENPIEPIGVVAIDKISENRKRYQIWTSTYFDRENNKLVQGLYQVLEPIDVNGTLQWNTSKPEVNPYGKIPFAFVPWQMPTQGFWAGSPGDNLTVANDYVNRRLSKIGSAQEFLCEPIRIVKHARNFKPGIPKPGEWISVEPAIDDQSGERLDVEIEDIQPDYTFNDAGWNDLNSFIDLTLEIHGIPLSGTRMVQSTGRSGTSIMMEQWPLAVSRKSRQPLWRNIEHDLATIVFMVAGIHLKNEKYLELSNNLDLTVTYPEVFMEVPGEERDRANSWELENGLKSKVQVYQERQGVNRDEALQHLAQVARDDADLARLTGDSLVGPRDQQGEALAGEGEAEGDQQTELEVD